MDVAVIDSDGAPVYATVGQDPNDDGKLDSMRTFCGTAAGFPIDGSLPVYVIPWAGPGIDDVLDPGGDACAGSLDAELVLPGVTGSVWFTFH